MFRMCWSVLLRLVPSSFFFWGSALLLCQGITHDSGVAGPIYRPHMVFDVVSIHPSREGSGKSADMGLSDSRSQYLGIEPAGLVIYAYGLQRIDLVKGLPDWAWKTSYDVEAKSDTTADEALVKLSRDDVMAEKRHMLQELLADRFKLKIHEETRMTTIYELVTTPRTAKLMTPVQVDPRKGWSSCNRHFSNQGMELDSKGCPFAIFLSGLSQELATDVVDHTGLSGGYAYRLMWNPRPPTPGDSEAMYPGLKDAVTEQLGLELKKKQGPVTYWVVDSIQRPSEN